MPPGDAGDAAADADTVLASADRSALLTATRYTTQGSAEIAGGSEDLVLASLGGNLHTFGRDPNNGQRLVHRPLIDGNVRDTVAGLLAA